MATGSPKANRKREEGRGGVFGDHREVEYPGGVFLDVGTSRTSLVSGGEGAESGGRSQAAAPGFTLKFGEMRKSPERL